MMRHRFIDSAHPRVSIVSSADPATATTSGDRPVSHPIQTDVRFAALPILAMALCAVGLTGCSMSTTAASAINAPVTGIAFSGHVHGGQQPVTGAVIQLYAASSSGYGAAATPLLTTAVTSDASGSFSITGDYTCPSNSLVYLTATGGNPGLGAGANNPNLALMAALGPCSGLTPSTSIQINELTTVASIWPLARFMTGYAAVGTTSTNRAGLTSAFNAVNKVVNVGSGALPGTSLPVGATLPTAEINTLADILAACINSSGGAAGDNTSCGSLFSAATPPAGTAPTDTVAAAINIARNPGNNLVALFGLASPAAPYQPTLTSAPNNFLVGISYVGGGLSTPKSLAVDASGNVWTANSGNASLTELSANGAALSPVAGFTGGGLNVPSSIAIDPSGNLWISTTAGNSVSKFASTGVPFGTSPFTGGGLNAPSGISVDGGGNVWVANSGNSSVSEFNSAGAALSTTAGYTGAGLNGPVGIAVNPH